MQERPIVDPWARLRAATLTTFLIGFLAAALSLPLLSAAAEPPIFERNGVALGGTDPVAYFTRSEPVRGSAEHALEWQGVTWWFYSADTRARFEASPERYAPQYGGWCAWAAAQGYAAPTVPDAWKIVDDRLYLNASTSVQRRWERDIPGFIDAADANWPNIF
jgi:YHS domain-containing protein